jgi:hypothetical protein
MTGSALRSACAQLLWPRLTSGSSSQPLSVLIAHGKLPDLPGYGALTFPLMPVGSTSRRSVQVLGFASIGPLTPPCRLYPLPVRQASVLPTASSRFRLATDTLAVQLTLPLAGCVEDFHLQVSAPCRAHQEKRGDSLSPHSRSLVSFFTVARPVPPCRRRAHLPAQRPPWRTMPSGLHSERPLLPRRAAAGRPHECSALWSW